MQIIIFYTIDYWNKGYNKPMSLLSYFHINSEGTDNLLILITKGNDDSVTISMHFLTLTFRQLMLRGNMDYVCM